MFNFHLIEKARAIDYNIHFLRDNVSPKEVGQGTDAVGQLANTVINIMVYIAGILAVIYIVYSGILYITAAGNPDAAKKGQQGILYGAIGVAVIVIAYIAVTYVASYVGGNVK